VVSLVKPQFEAGREQVGKKGVVKDAAVHLQVLERVVGSAREAGLNLINACYSPIKGPNGNIEYFIYLTKKAEASSGIDLANLAGKPKAN
jgi:23S rRNA (cytidine1920-2'-O)/16S rRNA (cytidine1409-2'-O)-methyltransferase